MRLTVLGSGTIALSPRRSCAAYYLEAGGSRLLIDCGSGTTRRLAELGIPWQELTHVALTHFHVDHHADLPTLLFAWKYGMLPARTAPLDIFGPAGTRDLLGRLAAAYGDWVTTPGYDVRITELNPVNPPPGQAASGAASGTEPAEAGEARVQCFKVPHTSESIAYSVSHNGRRLVYSGDTGFDPSFAEWARGSDVLVLECSLPSTMAIPEHLTPEQCGEMARIAEPGLLVLTHLYPPVEAEDIPARVAASYSGPVVIANDGWQTEIRS